MVNSISAIGSYANPNQDYFKIIQELQQLGIRPTGNQQVDNEKLKTAKHELIEKIQHKEEVQQAKGDQQHFQSQMVGPVENVNDPRRSEMEEQRLGAMNVAELNKIYFGLN